MNSKTPKNSRGKDYTSYTRPLPLVSDINNYRYCCWLAAAASTHFLTSSTTGTL